MSELKIQFCSGGSRIPGWLNTDLEFGEQQVDITKPLPFADNSADACRIEHGAEHISTHECLRFFDEVYRILKPGGTFRLSIPVLDMCLRVFDGKGTRPMSRVHARDLIFGHGHQCAFSSELAYIFLYLAGFNEIQRVERDEFDHHHTVIGEEKDNIETARFVATK